MMSCLALNGSSIPPTPIFNITEKEAEEVEEPEDGECATKRCFLDGYGIDTEFKNPLQLWLPAQDLCETESTSPLSWREKASEGLKAGERVPLSSGVQPLKHGARAPLNDLIPMLTQATLIKLSGSHTRKRCRDSLGEKKLFSGTKTSAHLSFISRILSWHSLSPIFITPSYSGSILQ